MMQQSVDGWLRILVVDGRETKMMRVRWRMIVEQSRQATLAICALLVGLFSFPLLAGCGGDGKSDKKAGGERKVEKKGGEEAAPATGLKQYSLAELPKLDEPLAPRDQNRLEISPPKGWTILNRDPANPSQIARFCEKDPNDLPRLTIIAEDSPLPDLAEMTEKTRRRSVRNCKNWRLKKHPIAK